MDHRFDSDLFGIRRWSTACLDTGRGVKARTDRDRDAPDCSVSPLYNIQSLFRRSGVHTFKQVDPIYSSQKSETKAGVDTPNSNPTRTGVGQTQHSGFAILDDPQHEILNRG